jgi:hypothetical protein
MKPISVSSMINKNGVTTLYVLTDNGTILKKAEDESRWTEIDAVPGHRNEPESGPDMASSNKGRKKRGS